METKKTNYHELGISQYRDILKSNNFRKPRLLLHVCCGACSCYPLIYLSSLFQISILFSNSNIYPKSEFDIRLNALKKYVKWVNQEFDQDIEIIEDNYDYEEFKKDLYPYKDQPEQQDRCKICITKRLIRLFDYAKEHDFHLVTTVMSISRNKDAQFINDCGNKIANNYDGIEYFYSDFKKNNGQLWGIELSKKFNVYRQEYCGCEFSIRNK